MFEIALKIASWYGFDIFAIFKSIEIFLQNTTLYGARFKSWTGGNGFARKYVHEYLCYHKLC